MKRLRRWGLNGLAAMSLALLLATTLFWMASDIDLRPERYHPILSVGRINIGAAIGDIVYQGPPSRSQPQNVYLPVWDSPDSLGSTNPTIVIIPCWVAAAVFAILPVLWMAPRVRPKRRIVKGHCHKCGYDIRATPDRCPECGTVLLKKA